MSEEISKAQSEIPGPKVAQMIIEFWQEFRGIYGDSTMTSDLCAVGPLQSMIGLAIRNGHLRIPATKPVPETLMCMECGATSEEWHKKGCSFDLGQQVKYTRPATPIQTGERR